MADDPAAVIRSQARIERHLDGQRRRIDIIVGAGAGIGWRLDRYLHAALPTLRRTLLMGWIEQGFVTIAGRQARCGLRIRAHDRISLDCPMPEPPPEDDTPPASALTIRYDHGGVLVVDKPAGMLVHQAGRRLSGTLLNHLQDLAVARGLDPACVHLVNRIDRDTSGLVLAALDDAVNSTLAIALQQGRMHKEYRAICRGLPTPTDGDWLWPIRPDPSGASIARFCHPDGQPSHTGYRVLETAGDHALLACRLHTGRQHQIRVHAAQAGHPLLGDWVYGYPCQELAGQALHAAILTFPDPHSGEPRTVQSPLPPPLAGVWSRLGQGWTPTPRHLDEEERSRLGLTHETGDPVPLRPGWRAPSWLDETTLRQLAREAPDEVPEAAGDWAEDGE